MHLIWCLTWAHDDSEMWQVSSQALTFQVESLQSKLVIEEIYWGSANVVCYNFTSSHRGKKRRKDGFQKHIAVNWIWIETVTQKEKFILYFWKHGMLPLSCNTFDVDINKLTEIPHGNIKVKFRLAPQTLESGHKQYGTTAGCCKRAPIQHQSLLTSWTHLHSECDSRRL